MKKRPDDETMQALRRAGLRHPDVEEGLACKGTVIESATLKVRGKAFLFLRPQTAMLKLGKSQAEATKLAAKRPACYTVGSGGWTKVSLADPKQLSMKVLEKWIAESYQQFSAPTKPKRK